jgi:hypothetical protein
MDENLRRFTTADLNKHIGAITDAAMSAPVVITHHRRPRFVLMSVGAYEAMANLPGPDQSGDPREPFTLESLPAEIEEGLLALAAKHESDASGGS